VERIDRTIGNPYPNGGGGFGDFFCSLRVNPNPPVKEEKEDEDE
jgi:hypothetical protein